MTVHVSPSGDDTNDGSASAPLASLVAARDALRSQRSAGELDEGAVVVLLHEGVYRLTETLVLGEGDSGTPDSPVIWMAAPGEVVRLVGGVQVRNWQALSDPAVADRLTSEARRQVMVSDLSSLGITDFGTVQPGTGRAEVFFDGRYLTLARYPNEGFVRIARVPEEAKHARPISNPKRPDLNRHAGPFHYAGNRPETWASTEGVWVHGYWYHDWSDQLHQVERFDVERKELWVKPPYHGYGYKEGQRYYYLNVLDELDRPGEWYLDRDTGRLYLWPPSPIEDAEVFFPDLDEPMIVLQDADHISLRGLVFECSRAGAIAIRGGTDSDVSGCVVRNVGGTAIAVKDGTGHTVRSCDVYEVAGSAVSVNGGDRASLTPAGHLVENCHIHHFARVWKTYRPGVSLQGVGNRVSRCYIHDCPHQGIGYGGNDHTVEYTEFTRVARETGDVGAIYAAMDWTYMGHVFRYNYFHDIHGPGKLGCFTVYPDLPCGGIHLHGNIFYNVDQIFHTNSGRGMLIENNLFLNADRGLSFSTWSDMKKFQLGGNWNMVERLHEVHYDRPPYSTRYPVLARLAEDFAKGADHVYERAIPKDNVVRRNISAGNSYFLIIRGKAGLQHVQVENNVIADPIVLIGSPEGDGKSRTHRSDDEAIREILARSGNVVSAEPPSFVNPAQGDFRLEDRALADEIGFEPIPFEEIGLRLDAYRRRLPEPLPEPLSTPTFDPPEGFYRRPVTVRVELPETQNDGTVHYTLDGSDPSRDSPAVSGPIVLRRTTTLTCVAFPPFGKDLDPSPTARARYFVRGTLAEGVFLSDLPLAADYVGYEPIGLLRDVAYAGRPIRLGGDVVEKGLITHPVERDEGNLACAEFALDGDLQQASRLTATIGIEGQAPTDKPGVGTCAFAVDLRRKGTWQRVFQSEVMRAGDAPRTLDIGLSGADRLRLIATDGGDGIGWDHAVWGRPLLHGPGSKP